jgi:probable HAF family extracellular repeat protein
MSRPLLPLTAALVLCSCEADRSTQPRGSGAPRYELVLLSAVIGAPADATEPGTRSYPYAVSENGTPVGMALYARPAEATGPAIWQRTGAPRAAGSIWVPQDCLDYGGSFWCGGAAFDINAAGWVVGSHSGGAWLVADGRKVDLGALLPGPSSARGINGVGDVVGYGDFDPGHLSFEHAALWRNGAVHDLGTLGGVQSGAFAINDRGWIVGYARVAGRLPPRHAFVWRDGVMTDLGTIDGSESVAYDINRLGQVVGWTGEIEYRRAFIWEADRMRLLAGTERSEAVAINSAGDAVGWYSPAGTFEIRAALWRGASRYDLTESVPPCSCTLELAYDINDAGQIVVQGRRSDGREQAWLLNPTPR